MTEVAAAELTAVMDAAQCLADMAAVEAAITRMAQAVSARLARTNPLVLGIMTGAVVPLGLLLPRLAFPLQVDYAHVTRYGAATSGGELNWIKRPPPAVAGRTVLIVDDVLDHGLTLAAIIEACVELGATQVLTAVLVTKQLARRTGLACADFSALTLPDAYLFGCGMDYKTYLRNAPGIFALADTR